MTSKAPFDPTTQLNGKTVVVIGGSSGIGLAVALQARALGAALFIVGRSADKLGRAAERIGKGTATLEADAHDHSTLDALFERLPPFDHLRNALSNAS